MSESRAKPQEDSGIGNLLTLGFIACLVGYWGWDKVLADHEPKNLAECLARASKMPTSEGVTIAAEQCRQQFSFQKTGKGLPSGSLYAPLQTATCVEFGVSSGVWERDRSGALLYVWPNESGATVIHAKWFPDAMEAEWPADSTKPAKPIRLFYTRAECERSITPEARAAAERERQEQAALELELMEARFRTEAATRAAKAKNCCECLAQTRCAFSITLREPVNACITHVQEGNHAYIEWLCAVGHCDRVCHDYKR